MWHCNPWKISVIQLNSNMTQKVEKNLTKAERIWQTVIAIPEGKVASYSQIADLAGLPGRARYVSKAMSLAPDTMKLPWYRVLRSDGKLAFPISSKAALLQSNLLSKESVPVLKNRVSMQQHQWQPELSEILSKLDFQKNS